MKRSTDRCAFRLFVASIAVLIFSYGVAVGMLKYFPYEIIRGATDGYTELCKRFGIGDELPWYYKRVKSPYRPAIRNTAQAYQGLNLVAEIAADHRLLVKIMDMEGKTVHQWDTDWFKIWPDAKHVPEWLRPKSPPGTLIHGSVIMKNGDLVFNFERLGLVRLDRQGKVVWRLPYLTHHSIYLAADGNLWVCGMKDYSPPGAPWPNRKPPYIEGMLLKVTPEGKIAREWSVHKLLIDNGLAGLLNLSVRVRAGMPRDMCDLLHLNDVEPFPAGVKEGFFKKGDTLVSLHDVNTVFVFNRESEKIKFICTGFFTEQHDPDFIDGNTFSVFDNGKFPWECPQSRIAIVSASDNTIKTYYQGTPEHPFFSQIMGKHQWLPNGNLLITSTCEGRAFEVNRHGEIVWEYVNYVDKGMVGAISEVTRLPSDYARFYTGTGSGGAKSPAAAAGSAGSGPAKIQTSGKEELKK